MRATNNTAAVAVSSALAVTPIGYLIVGWWPIPILLALTTLFALGPVLSRLGHVDLSRFLFGFSGLFSVCVFYPVVGLVLAIMTLPAGLGAFTFFTAEEGRYRWLLIALSALTAALMYAHTTLFGDPSMVAEDLQDVCAIALFVIAGATAVSHVRSLDNENVARQQELAKAAAAARQAVEAKEAFLANMSHELRTPMNGVIGMTSLLRTTGLDDNQRRMVDVVHTSGEALLVLLNDVLDLAKMRTTTFQLRPENTALHEVVEQVGDLFRPTASDKGVALEVEVAPEVPAHVRADPTRLRQLLSNLVGNAVKFTDEGRVALTVHLDDTDALRFVVADTGPGIPPSMVDRLFEPFEQLDDGHNRTHGGTGLGLAIVKQLTEAMGGTIEVASTLGEGATFAATLPLPPVTPLPLPPLEARPARQVLVVDDDAINRRIARSMLEHLGLQTREVASADACLDTVEEHAFDLILMVAQSAMFDTDDLARRLRSTTSATRTRLCGMVRGTADTNNRCGFDAVVAKPLHLDALEALVQGQLGAADTAPPSAQSA